MLVIHQAWRSTHPTKRLTQNSAMKSEGDAIGLNVMCCDLLQFAVWFMWSEFGLWLRFRKKAITAARGSAAAAAVSKNPRKGRKVLQESSSFCRAVPPEEVEISVHFSRRNIGAAAQVSKGATASRVLSKPSYDTRSEVSQALTEASQADTVCSAPLETTAAATTRAKTQKQDSSRTHSNAYYANSRTQKLNNVAAEPSAGAAAVQAKRASLDSSDGGSSDDNVAEKRAMRKQRLKAGRIQSFDSSEIYLSRKSSLVRNISPSVVSSDEHIYMQIR